MPAPTPENSHRSSRIRTICDALLICTLVLFSCIGLVAALPGAGASEPGPVAAVFAPWVSADEALRRGIAAGGRVLRPGSWPFVILLASEPEDGTADERPHGAWFVLRLDGLRGCGLDFGGRAP